MLSKLNYLRLLIIKHVFGIFFTRAGEKYISFYTEYKTNNRIIRILQNNDLLHPANLLSFSRVIIIPLIYYCHVLQIYDIVLALMLFIGLTDFIDGAMYEFIRDEYEFENKFGVIIDPICDRIVAISLLFYIFHLDFINKALLGMELILGIAIIITILWPDLKKYKIQTHREDFLGKIRYLILGFFFLFSYYFGFINPEMLSNNIFVTIKLTFLIIILSLVFVSFIYFIVLNLSSARNKVTAVNQ